ncbi:HIT family protein [Paracoccus luteus]|uniref:HIT family protein n=1 Tax=Paracoccus luteus TaxID=2508543 RepID=UPI00106FD849|nr:HIT family protein [Paracoccus luteus]
MTHDCLFCRIARGDLPAHVVHEDDEVVAFLDLHPIRPGHTLVIPKAHHVWFEDIPAPLAARVMACSQTLSHRMKRIYGVERVAMFFTGIHVPHAHAHVVPMHHVHDVSSQAYLADGPDGYSVPPQLDPERMAAIARDLAQG